MVYVKYVGVADSATILAIPFSESLPDSKIHGANVGPTWGHQDPGGPHVGHTNLAIWAYTDSFPNSA